jgi:hypothetical protein
MQEWNSAVMRVQKRYSKYHDVQFASYRYESEAVYVQTAEGFVGLDFMSKLGSTRIAFVTKGFDLHVSCRVDRKRHAELDSISLRSKVLAYRL